MIYRVGDWVRYAGEEPYISGMYGRITHNSGYLFAHHDTWILTTPSPKPSLEEALTYYAQGNWDGGKLAWEALDGM